MLQSLIAQKAGPVDGLNSAELDAFIEQYKLILRESHGFTHCVVTGFDELFVGLSEKDASEMCNKKLGLPVGTVSTPHDLLRMVKFDALVS